MIHYFEGTVFNAPVKTIVNTVNCMGFMGAGIALEFRLRFPKMYEEYKIKCEKKEVKLGRPYIYENTDKVWILNFPTKGHWKYPSKIKWIEDGLKYFAENHHGREIESIAFPKLGCSNGGLKWDVVKPLMERYLCGLSLEIYMCLDEKSEPEGSEKDMLELINSASISDLVSGVGINKKQAEAILSKLPFKRVRYIERLVGIGDKSYSRLFSYYYSKVTNKEPSIIFLDEPMEYKQLSLFDDSLLYDPMSVEKKK